MEDNFEKLKREIISFLEEHEFTAWSFFSMKLQFPPFINKGYKGQWYFMDSNKNIIDKTIFLSEKFNFCLYKFIYSHNQSNEYNTLHFFAKKNEYEKAISGIMFDQLVEDIFQNNLPKSKRGKTLPWWKIESETIGLDQANFLDS